MFIWAPAGREVQIDKTKALIDIINLSIWIHVCHFGKSEVYYNMVEATLIIRPKTQKKTNRTLALEYQGCWEGGVCYPIEKIYLKL